MKFNYFPPLVRKVELRCPESVMETSTDGVDVTTGSDSGWDFKQD